MNFKCFFGNHNYIFVGNTVNTNYVVYQCMDCGIYEIVVHKHSNISYKTRKPPKLNDVVEIPSTGIGDLSDGYHTFNELYHHRAILFSVLCNHYPQISWKSKLHDDGTMYDNMFIVGIETPLGQATYHYDIAPYWDIFKVKETEKAPIWDGHTPEQAIDRIFNLGLKG